ncbi:GNAT family N-acetyltransferase [Pseudonocardia spinosispora]|uniref:GNAT family N-acetyltransferase n=1 Tax=Pseudonocardia spinosispora TaxID=103441 RepID=UPI00040BE397|nr:GNAT family N-acetyltransferase [Pseudonocardia spinosispora]
MAEVVVRAIEARDVDAVVAMVYELAVHEEMPEHCHLEPEQLHRALFGERPALFGLVAEHDGQVDGYALYFLNFSTWDGVHGIYVEDLYIRPTLRGRGVGRQMWSHLARTAVERGYTRLECVTLHENTLGMDVHLKLGARPLTDWQVLRWDGTALHDLAGTSPSG